ncbi:DUF6161 domain-containing protein [Sphingomonas albertensis]|uniref:DUF6161 domain-containing protein n=1 Tax=Sphingomonas albertensis TaxID=2762591 RepID=A0ABR7APX9_9SPHN|nr:DUF6161 domain-containing protein [Sphingomonas albertensis]MBC3942498.1 hypothetical protein [Sphingomonas albertensis]
MSVIQFDIAPERGGKKEFNDLAEAILWAQRQREAWDNEYREIISTNPNHPFAAVRGAWDRVTEDLRANHMKGLPVALTINDARELIADKSPIFLALNWVAHQLTAQGVLAASAIAGLSGVRINWADTNQTNAVILYERSLARILKTTAENLVEQMQIKAADAEARVSLAQESAVKVEGLIAQMTTAANHGELNGRERLAALEATIGAAEFSTNTQLAELDQKLGAISSQAGTAIENLTRSSRDTIENWFKAFKEQRQLEAPVALWEARAETHEKTLRSRKWWMIGVGAIGLFGACAVAIVAFEGANHIFSNAVIPTKDGNPFNVNGMRASFHFELLLASAGTLLYLTMYLWTMRLLVRLYTTEHHLAIDAKGRSALTETYLSLTKEGAATDADRAIMLAVIFRPVADGMVKEDGPPAISPAALIATLASGTGKPG